MAVVAGLVPIAYKFPIIIIIKNSRSVIRFKFNSEYFSLMRIAFRTLLNYLPFTAGQHTIT